MEGDASNSLIENTGMAEIPPTRPSLLVRVRDAQDAAAWQEFVGLYGPLLYRFARQRGWQDADAADLTQTVLQELAGDGVRRYDVQRGSFRNWLFGIVRNQMRKLQNRPRPGLLGSGDTTAQELLEEQPAGAEESALWEQEYQRQCFAWAAEKVRPDFAESSWRAFWLTAVEGITPAEAAATLDLTIGAVYTAKSRVLDRIKKEIRQLLEEE
jgi:RNA polymerase sigma-70 factor (ECF subfamily)